MSTMRLVIVLSSIGYLTAALPVLAESMSSPQTSWTISTQRPDSSLRDPLVRRGKEIFQARCQACHGDYPKDRATGGLLNIPPMPGTQALRAKYKGELPDLLEERTDLTPEAVAVFVRQGSGSMPFFRPTEVSDEDLKALGAYLARKRR
jgi:(+)-pinoresinol hydroxylase